MKRKTKQKPKGVIKVTAYRTPDGTLFENKEQAEEACRAMNRRQAIEKFVADECWNNMTPDDIVDVLEENIVLIKALAEY